MLQGDKAKAKRHARDMGRLERYLLGKRAYNAFGEKWAEVRKNPPDAALGSWEYRVWEETKEWFGLADDSLRDWMDHVWRSLIHILEDMGGEKGWVIHGESRMSARYCYGSDEGAFSGICLKATTLVQEKGERLCVECRRLRGKLHRSRRAKKGLQYPSCTDLSVSW